MAGTVYEVHCTAHALDHLAGHGPVREITMCGNLHSAEDCYIGAAAVDHAERE